MRAMNAGDSSRTDLVALVADRLCDAVSVQHRHDRDGACGQVDRYGGLRILCLQGFGDGLDAVLAAHAFDGQQVVLNSGHGGSFNERRDTATNLDFVH